MSFVHSPKIITEGLVLALDAGNTKSYTSGSTTWFDKSGNANNGTLTNGPTFSSANGGSIVFDGADDYVQSIPSSPVLEMQPTIPYSCFIMYKTSLPVTGIIASNMDSTSQYSGWDIFLSSTSNIGGMHLISTWSSNAIKIQFNLSSSLYTNQWMYFGYTYDGSSPATIANSINSVSFYVNGILSNNGQTNENATGFTSTSATIPYTTNQRFRLGSRWAPLGTNSPSPGNIGLFQLYKNKKLSASEIQQNFNALRGRYGI
jgi:hypothetical protein